MEATSKNSKIKACDRSKSGVYTEVNEHFGSPDISQGFVTRVRKRAWIQGARSEGAAGILDDMSRHPNKRNAVDMPDCAPAVETLWNIRAGSRNAEFGVFRGCLKHERSRRQNQD